MAVCYSFDLAKVCLCLSQLLLCFHLINYQSLYDYRTVWSRLGINSLCCMARSLYERNPLHIYLFDRYCNNSLLVGDDRMVYRFLAGVCGLSSILPSCGNIGCYQLYSDLLYPCNKRDRTTKKDGLNPFTMTVLMFCFQPLTFIKKLWFYLYLTKNVVLSQVDSYKKQ